MRELRDIILDAKDNIMEACAAGYADGFRQGWEEGRGNGELCDNFIDLWNDRARLLKEHGWHDAMQWLEERERDEWCDGFIRGWNANAHVIGGDE